MTTRGLRRGNWSVQELARLKNLLPRRGVPDTAILLRRSPDSVRKKAVELFHAPPHKAAWSLDEELALRRAWGAVEPRLIAVIIGRSQQEVLRRAAALRASPRSGPWTRTEERLLKELYGTRRDDDLEVCLQRPSAEIAAAAARLCLSKDKRFVKTVVRNGRRMPRWTQAEIRRLTELYPDRENLEVARLLQRSVASVANKAHRLRLGKSALLLARIGRANVAVRYRGVPLRD